MGLTRRRFVHVALLAGASIGLSGLSACGRIAPQPTAAGPTGVPPTPAPAATGQPKASAAQTVSPAPTAPPARPKPAVGAIRWDAWVGEAPTFGDSTSQNRVGLVVEQTLAPAKWHYRLPFYAVELGENKVQVRATTQAIMDREIAYAKDAGLDYWAFVYYRPGSGLDAARNLYLSSAHRSDMRFCLIFDSLDNLKDALASGLLIDDLKRPEYQTVLDHRPLLYLLNISGGSEEDDKLIRDTVAAIRTKATAAGVGNPYIATMGGFRQIKTYGLDGISTYAEAGSGGIPYARLARNAEVRWESYRPMHLKVIPWVTAGWDPRPRIEHPTPWATYNADSWAQAAKPDEIAQHLQNALRWTSQHPDTNEANAIIMYAWNEFDEGGWICPTLHGGTERLDAIAGVLAAKESSLSK
jgi:hypothetical protein